MNYGEFIAKLRKDPISHVFLLFGEEPYYIEKARREIIKRLVPSGEEKETVVTIEGNFPPEKLVNLASSIPFFTERNVILVKGASLFTKKEAQGEEKIIKLLKDVPEKSFIIFECQSALDKRLKLFKAVAKEALVLESDPIKPWNIGDWLSDKLWSLDLELDREGREYFMNTVSMMKEVSLTYWDMEFEKLALFSEKKLIGKREMEEVFSAIPEVNVFGVLDAIDAKDAARGIMIMRRELSRSYAPMMVGLLARHIRDMIQAKLLMKKGVPQKALGKAMGLNPFIAERLGRNVQKFAVETLEAALLSLSEADYRMKTGGGEYALEEIIIKLAR